MRLLWRIAKWVGGVLLVAIAGLALYVSVSWNRSWNVPMPDVKASSDPAVIARGEYLATGPAHCVECHMTSVEEYLRFREKGERPSMAGGYPFPLGPLGALYARNITSDRETGIGRFSDQQIARMLRHGVRPGGQASIPLLMPYGDMSDDDVQAVVSFLQYGAGGAQRRAGKRVDADGQGHANVRPGPPAEARRTPGEDRATLGGYGSARGQYLALSVANCGGCHSPFNPLTAALVGPRFSGGEPLMEPAPLPGVDRSLWFKPPNITPLKGSALMKFPDRATFVARFKVGGRKYVGIPDAVGSDEPDVAGGPRRALRVPAHARAVGPAVAGGADGEAVGDARAGPQSGDCT